MTETRKQPDAYRKQILPKRKRYRQEKKCIDCGKESETLRCVDCHAQIAKYKREWRLRNLERSKETQKRWRANHPERDKEKQARYTVKRKYGISLEEYRKLVDPPCGICGRVDKIRVLDHCHQTKNIRGGLCVKCNNVLGWYELHIEAIHKWVMGGRS